MSGGGRYYLWMPPKHTSTLSHYASALSQSSPTNQAFRSLLALIVFCSARDYSRNYQGMLDLTYRCTQGRDVQSTCPSECWNPRCLLTHGNSCSVPSLSLRLPAALWLGWGMHLRKESQKQRVLQEAIFSVVCLKKWAYRFVIIPGPLMFPLLIFLRVSTPWILNLGCTLESPREFKTSQ